MKFKKDLALCMVVIGTIMVPGIVLGKSVLELFPHSRTVSKRSVSQEKSNPSSTIIETSQQTGVATGFVNSSSVGTGEPGSATASAWQGGQTFAQGSQTATADQNSNLNSQTSGSSNCQQGYTGSGSGSQANSVGSALCNATNNQVGVHDASLSKEQTGSKMGWHTPMHFAGFQPPTSNFQPPAPNFQPAASNSKPAASNSKPAASNSNSKPLTSNSKPLTSNSKPPTPNFQPPINMNYTVAMIGEAQSGQVHNSMSNVGGELSGIMNIFAGGIAETPQGSMTFSHSAIDAQGNPINANQTLSTTPGLNSEEHTLVDLSGTSMGHLSGGLAQVQGLGNSANSSYNSHAVEEKSGGFGSKVGITLQ